MGSAVGRGFQPRSGSVMMLNFDISAVQTPCYVVDERLLEDNCRILREVQEKSGAKILLAQKAFSMYSTYPLISQYLCGTTASGLYEARLGREEFGGEVHIFSPAYSERDFGEILEICDHIVFNTPAQWRRFRPLVEASPRKISCGLRINPEYAETETEIYNPCAKGSRLGTTAAQLCEEDLDGLEGLHFHTMCEQNSDVLARTLPFVEEKFGKYLKQMKWLNFGGGHHITRADYDRELLVKCCRDMAEKYGVQIYLEPGEAVALNAGFLVSEVLEFVENGGITNAILDTSAACHMPDVLEMPYRPNIIGAGQPGEKPYTYRFGGPTCLAGDIIGDYSFDAPLSVGDRLVFCDMAIYSMVKNNTFNGMPLPSIFLCRKDGGLAIIRKFGYTDFKSRL